MHVGARCLVVVLLVVGAQALPKPYTKYYEAWLKQQNWYTKMEAPVSDSDLGQIKATIDYKDTQADWNKIKRYVPDDTLNEKVEAIIRAANPYLNDVMTPAVAGITAVGGDGPSFRNSATTVNELFNLANGPGQKAFRTFLLKMQVHVNAAVVKAWVNKYKPDGTAPDAKKFKQKDSHLIKCYFVSRKHLSKKKHSIKSLFKRSMDDSPTVKAAKKAMDQHTSAFEDHTHPSLEVEGKMYQAMRGAIDDYEKAKKGVVQQIQDALRTSLVCYNDFTLGVGAKAMLNGAIEMYPKVKSLPGATSSAASWEVKNQFPQGRIGYADVKAFLEFKFADEDQHKEEKITVEVQIQPRNMFDGNGQCPKEYSHYDYNIRRVMSDTKRATLNTAKQAIWDKFKKQLKRAGNGMLAEGRCAGTGLPPALRALCGKIVPMRLKDSQIELSGKVFLEEGERLKRSAPVLARMFRHSQLNP